MIDRMLLNKLLSSLEASAKQDGVTKHVGGVVPVIDGGILIIKRAESEDFLADYWELPSGGREISDTTIFDIAERELLEETGLKINNLIHYLGFFDYETKTNKKVRQWNFLVQVTNDVIILCPNEHDEYRIVKNEQDLPAEMLISAETRNVIIQSFKHIKEQKI